MADVVAGYIYGMRDIKITTSDGVTQVDLPAAQTMTWTDTIVSADLRGDDVIVSSVAFIEGAEVTLNAGGITLEAYALLTGESVASAGTTPDRTETITRTGGKSYPWIKAYGRALGDADDGLHVLLNC